MPAKMNLLLVLYFITVCLFLHNSASDQQITIKSNTFSKYLVSDKENLYIIFENFTGSQLQCYIGSKLRESDSLESKVEDTYKIKILILMSYMTTNWSCKELDGKSATIGNKTYVFELMVIKNVNMTINDNSVKFNITKTYSSQMKYVGIYEHTYKIGDTIDVTCKNMYDEGQITLEYYDAQGTRIIDTRLYEHKTGFYLTFRKLVRDESVNNSYADCSYITNMESDNGRQQKFTTFAYRIVFTLTKEDRKDENFTVIINDMKLTPNDRDTYIYKFINWQPINLYCEKKSELQGFIKGKLSNPIVQIKDLMAVKHYKITIGTINLLDGDVFQCYTESMLQAQIKFIKDLNRDPFVQGLSVSKILYQYNTGDLKWIIYYQYVAGEELNLTCITEMDRTPNFEYEDKNSTDSTYQSEYYTMNTNHLFTVNSDYLYKNIICRSKKNTTSARELIIYFQQTSTINTEFTFTTLEIIGATVGIVLSAVTAICMFYWWRSKRNITKEQVRYENFTGDCNQTDENHEYMYIQNEYMDNTNRHSVMRINNIYIGAESNHYTENNMKTKPDEANHTYAEPYELVNTNKNKTVKNVQCNSFENRKGSLQSRNKSIDIIYNNLEEKSSSSGYNNLEHLISPSYSNLNAISNKKS